MIASPRALAGAAAPGAGGQVIVDLDATIVISHSDKDHARPTWKKTYGFHPMTAFADHGPGGSGEPLAIMLLRPGNAGSNSRRPYRGGPAGTGAAARGAAEESADQGRFRRRDT